jgi:hypothetical protein
VDHAAAVNVSADLDDDARVVLGVDRRQARTQARSNALRATATDIERAIKVQATRLSELFSRLAVAEMTLQAMRSVLSNTEHLD